jgi:hypothetical protein
MARSQTWTRNIPKKTKPTVKPDLTRSIVDDRALEGIKRRAEDLERLSVERMEEVE